jgi:hypothetical protein
MYETTTPDGPIGIDHATLRSDSAGSHTRYTIALTGRPGEAWYMAYQAAREQAGLTKSFSIDRSRAVISFSVRVVEGPAHVMEMLERLEALLVSAEQRCDAWRDQAAPTPRPFSAA